MDLYEILDKIYWRSFARKHFWYWAAIWYFIGELITLWMNPDISWLGGPGPEWTWSLEFWSLFVCFLGYPLFYYYIWGKKKIEEEEENSND